MLIGHTIGSAEGIILSLDGAVSDMLQRMSMDVVGRSYLDITYAPDQPTNVTRLAALKVSDGATRIRKRYVRPDGSTIWVDTHVSRVSSGSDSGRLVGTLEWAGEGRHLETPTTLWRKARIMDAALRRRSMLLGPDLFGDYPWLILLQFYLAEAEGRILTSQDIADMSHAACDTIDRWILLLARKRLVERDNGAGLTAQLTQKGLDHVEDLIVSEGA